MNSVLWGVVVYIGVQFAIGVWVSQRIRTNTDFILAGRSLGPMLVSFSVFATFFGAEAIVGTAGSVFEKGLAGSQADPFGYGLAILLVGGLIAARLWRRGIVTFADFFADRFAPWVGKLVVVVLLPGSIFWAAAQIRAFGNVISAASGLEVQVTILIGLAVVVGYSVLGGLLADAWTDFVQGVAVVVGLVVLFIATIAHLGGIVPAFSSIPMERLNPVADTDFLSFIEGLAVPICGTLVAIEIISRVLGARSADVAVRGTILGGVLYILVGLIPVQLGLLAPGLVGNVSDAEQIVPIMAEKLLPTFFYILFIGAVISAILSTVDSVLLASAAQVAHNIVTPAIPNQSANSQLLTTRTTVVALGLVAYVIALSSDSVKDLVEIASAAGSSGVFIVTMAGLFTRSGGPIAAATTILSGTLSWSIFHWGLGLETPYVASLLVAGLTFGAFVAAPLLRR